VALLPLTGIPPDQVPAGSVQARQPAPKEGAVTGVVWRDFKPGGGTPGKLERGEVGLPNVSVQLRDSSGKTIGTTKTTPNGNFAFTGVKPTGRRSAPTRSGNPTAASHGWGPSSSTPQ
jgi:hypothetical protein